MDEVFGDDNFVSADHVHKTTLRLASGGTNVVGIDCDYIALVCEDKSPIKYRQLLSRKDVGGAGASRALQLVRDRDGSSKPSAATEQERSSPKSDSARHEPARHFITTRCERHTTSFQLISRARAITPEQGWLEDESSWHEPTHEGCAELMPTETALGYVRYLDDFPRILDQQSLDRYVIWSLREHKIYVVQTNERSSNAASSWPPTPATSCSTRPAVPAQPLCRRAMGPPLDHDRHIARRAGAGPRPHHGRTLSVLPAGRFSREGQLKEAEVTRTVPFAARLTATSARASSTSACRTSRSSPSPTTPRSTSSGRSGRRSWSRCAKKLNAALKKNWEEWEIPREADDKWPEQRRSCTPNGGKRASPGRRRSTPPSPPRPSSNTSTTSPTRTRRRSASPGRSPSRASRPHRVLGVDENDELIDGQPKSKSGRRRRGRLCPDDPGEPQDRRRAAGAQGRQDHLHVAHALARRLRLRRRPLLEGDAKSGRKARRHLHRPRVRHGLAPRSGCRRPRGRRCRLSTC